MLKLDSHKFARISILFKILVTILLKLIIVNRP
jgi:hypothetical protein